jgi:hypothetical protein
LFSHQRAEVPLKLSSLVIFSHRPEFNFSSPQTREEKLISKLGLFQVGQSVTTIGIMVAKYFIIADFE